MPQLRLRTRSSRATALAPAAFAVISTFLVSTALAMLAPAPAQAQSRFDYTLGFFAGVGGATDDAPDAGYSNPAGEVYFSVQTERHTYVSIRVGRLELQPDEGAGLLDSTLTYVAATGGYRFAESFYDSGVFLGLGGYRQEGDFLAEEDAFGFLAGVDGDFRLADRLSLVGQVTGHFVDLEGAQLYLTVEAGLAFHF